jgi:hypothetical protein
VSGRLASPLLGWDARRRKEGGEWKLKRVREDKKEVRELGEVSSSRIFFVVKMIHEKLPHLLGVRLSACAAA